MLEKKLRPLLKLDWISFVAMLSLVTIGLIMIFSTSSVVGMSYYNDGYFFIRKHLMFLAAGTLAFILGCIVPHHQYKKFAIAGLLFSLFLLVGTLIPGWQIQAGGATRWINLGLFQLQPVEVVKFFVVVYLSLFLENRPNALRYFGKGVLPVLVLLLFPLLLLAKQPDLGNLLLVLMIAFLFIFVGGIAWRLLIGLFGAAAIVVGAYILRNPYQIDRIKTFLFPWSDPLGKSYHIIQSFITIGSGGFWGRGIGEGKLKYFYLPMQYTDFIFAIICEEGGFLLAGVVIALFGVLFYRGLYIALKSQRPFSFYLGFGITFLLIIQALINIGVVIGVFPVTGIPLTFISFGGTALIMSMFYVGVLQNIYKTNASE